MKSILFLDIDGVMVLFGKGGIHNGIHDHDPFDKDCVQVLNKIIDETNCDIVISSTWKRDFDLKQIQEIFSWNGVKKIPIGFTPEIDEKLLQDKEFEVIKCREITKWLLENDPKARYKWCAVDDWDLSFELKNFVGCRDNKMGLKSKGISNKIILYLKTS